MPGQIGVIASERDAAVLPRMSWSALWHPAVESKKAH